MPLLLEDPFADAETNQRRIEWALQQIEAEEQQQNLQAQGEAEEGNLVGPSEAQERRQSSEEEMEVFRLVVDGFGSEDEECGPESAFEEQYREYKRSRFS